MGLTTMPITVANPRSERRAAKVRCVVDTGASYSIIRSAVLNRLGVRPDDEVTLALADGTEVKRRMGQALFKMAGKARVSTVIFGEGKDADILGVVTLEEMGVFLDPLERTLKPLKLMLANVRLKAQIFP